MNEKKGKVIFNTDGVNNQYYVPRATSSEVGSPMRSRPSFRLPLNSSLQSTAMPTFFDYPARCRQFAVGLRASRDNRSVTVRLAWRPSARPPYPTLSDREVIVGWSCRPTNILWSSAKLFGPRDQTILYGSSRSWLV